MTDANILTTVAALVRPTFRTDSDPLPHPDETALVHRIADWVEDVLDSHLGILEKAYEKGWHDCTNLAKTELDAQRREFVGYFSNDHHTELRRHAAAIVQPAEGRSDA